MFMDIRNFTPLVEKKPPEEIVAFQNVVFAEAIDIVNRNHGIINQFLGDGFMATFGAPLATGHDCANALAAARELVPGSGPSPRFLDGEDVEVVRRCRAAGDRASTPGSAQGNGSLKRRRASTADWWTWLVFRDPEDLGAATPWCSRRGEDHFLELGVLVGVEVRLG
jgi:hypothetical protein